MAGEHYAWKHRITLSPVEEHGRIRKLSTQGDNQNLKMSRETGGQMQNLTQIAY